MLIVDAHLDIAYGALEDGRNPLVTVDEIRRSEPRKPRAGRATVSFPQLREAGIAVVFGTIFVMPKAAARGDAVKMVYEDANDAHRLGMAELDYYHRLVDGEANRLRLVGDVVGLEEVIASQERDEKPLLGIVPLMEGADPIREPEELELWVEKGVRLIGPAWDDTRYAAGAWRGSGHGLTKAGRALLDVMNEFGLILDITHMNERASLEALDQYEGVVVATHSNCRALVPGERQLSDAQIRAVGERGGVIGTVLYNRFLRANHRQGDRKELVTLDHVVAHIDQICQVLGDARHVGLGTDMDGGFGADDIPAELDSAADLPLIATRLRNAGYDQKDVSHIMGQNWLELLRSAWGR
jgi:membrane dipeptidase